MSRRSLPFIALAFLLVAAPAVVALAQTPTPPASPARPLTDFPLLWRWLVGTASDPFACDPLVDITWKLMLVLGCALAAEWLILRGLRRPAAMLEARVPSPHRDDDRVTDLSPGLSPP